MKILGRHWYVVSSPTAISKEKREALARGRSHIHADPIRKAVSKPGQEGEKNAGN
jgi:hypothetical protein